MIWTVLLKNENIASVCCGSTLTRTFSFFSQTVSCASNGTPPGLKRCLELAHANAANPFPPNHWHRDPQSLCRLLQLSSTHANEPAARPARSTPKPSSTSSGFARATTERARTVHLSDSPRPIPVGKKRAERHSYLSWK